MKKFIAVLLVLTMLVSATAFAKNIILKSNAHLYKGAGTGKTDIVLKKGSVVECTYDHIGSKNTKITLANGQEYWVKSQYVKGFTDKKPQEIYAAGGTQKSTVSGSEVPVSGYTKVRATGKCNIRTSASLQGKAIGTFQKGKWMTFKGVKRADSRGIDWYKVVTSKGVEAWVSSVYTELEK